MMRTKVALGAIALAALHCSSSSDTPPRGGPPPPPSPDGGAPPTDVSCEKSPDPRCANAIDHALIPMLRSAGAPLREASAPELCRRMSVDLIGRIPLRAELDACVAKKPAEMADYFMAMPEYAAAQARPWGEVIGYDLNFKNWYGDVYDLNALVELLFATTSPLPYADFAARVAVHPAFYAAHQGDDWAAYLFGTFLGRAARKDEIAGMRPLLALWATRTACDGALWFQAFLAGGKPVADAFCSENGLPITEWAANFCTCAPGNGTPLGCTTSVLGAPIDLGTEGCRDPSDPGAQKNLVRLGDYSPGQRGDLCADGSRRAECKDRELAFDGATGRFVIGAALGVLPKPTAAQSARLRQIGSAMSARPDFWEAAADREIKRFIGWWKEGTRRPDFDVWEVRKAVAAELQKSGSIPQIQRLIVTSLLYVAPVEPPPLLKEPPLFAMGPTKLLAAEAWLDSVAAATQGAPLGYCDYRFVAGGSTTLNDSGPVPFVDPALVRRVPSALSANGFTSDSYYAAAQQLGGCSADGGRPRVSSVGVTYAEHDLAQTMCAYGALVLPPGFREDASEASLRSGAAHLVRQLLSRDATDDEKAALAGEMAECLAASQCTSAATALRWTCARIVDSGLFGLY